VKQKNLPGEPRPRVEALALSFSRRMVLRILAISWFAVGIALLYLDYSVNYSSGSSVEEIQHVFNMTREDGLCSFFSVTLATFLSLTLWLIWAVENRQQRGRWRPVGWLVIALWFTYMTLDDGSGLHEAVGTAFRVAAKQAHPGEPRGAGLMGFPSYAWQMIYIPWFGLLALFTMYYTWTALKSKKAWRFIFLAMSLNVCAVGMDFMEGLEESHPLNLYAKIAHRLDFDAYAQKQFDATGFETVVHFGSAFEEFIEMMAYLIFWLVFLDYLMRSTPQLEFRFLDQDRKSGASPP
jgi:hypothetical protein